MRISNNAAGLTIAAIVISGGCSGGNAQGELGQEVTKERFDTWMSELSNWGRWGADDQRGALNTITPEKRVQATGLVQSGTVVSMARPMAIVPLESPDDMDANRLPVLLGLSAMCLILILTMATFGKDTRLNITAAW